MSNHDSQDYESNPGRGWIIGGGLGLVLWILLLYIVQIILE